MLLNRLRIGTRLAAGFLAVLALVAAMAALGSWRLARVSDDAEQMMSLPIRKVRLANEQFRNLSVGVRRTTAIARSVDPSLEAFFADEARASTARGNEILKEIESLPMSADEKRLFDQVGTLRKPYLAARDTVMKARRDGLADVADRAFSTQFVPASAAYVDAMRAYLDHLDRSIDRLGADVLAAARSARNELLLLGGVALALGAVFAWLLGRSITTPLAAAVEAARTVAAGDLSRPIPLGGSDEAGALMRALADMQANLARVVGQVRGGVEALRVASTEIAAGNLDLSGRTEQTAGDLQQTASSIEQLTGTVSHTADSAQQANALAVSAAAAAGRGGEAVARVASTMETIEESSKKIASITSVIDSIAFQTNILALNAAVEAARAGEQGRGFAVVAAEVRVLARRCSDAAREISALIGASVDSVQKGGTLVREAGTTMDEVVRSFEQVRSVIGEITTAASEQSKGIGLVNGAVGKLEHMTQQNAALVEESSAAAERLKEQTGLLSEVVTTFRV